MTGELVPVPPLTAEVDAMIRAWEPLTGRHDPRIRDVVAPATRAIVTAYSPQSVPSARKMLQHLWPMLVWTDDEVGSVGSAVINPRNVEGFIKNTRDDRSPGWRSNARSSLTRIGRALNPEAWHSNPCVVSGRSRPIPYHPDDEARWQMVGQLRGRMDLARRLWVVAAPCATGMRGTELRWSEVSDIHERDDGLLVVDVRGDKPRRVPVRECWTDAVRQAVDLVNERPPGSSRRFFDVDCYAAARNAIASLPESVGGRFSLVRGRATWLAAHLAAGTRLDALQMLAGGLNEKTIGHLLRHLDPLTPDEAVEQGLRA